jgi:hypothetical protein
MLKSYVNLLLILENTKLSFINDISISRTSNYPLKKNLKFCDSFKMKINSWIFQVIYYPFHLKFFNLFDILLNGSQLVSNIFSKCF